MEINFLIDLTMTDMNFEYSLYLAIILFSIKEIIIVSIPVLFTFSNSIILGETLFDISIRQTIKQ